MEKNREKKNTVVGPVEYRSLKEDGGEVLVEAYSIAVLDDAGEPQGVLGMAHDITERKNRERLQRDENYVLTLLAQGAELNTVLDAIVRLGEANDPSIKGSLLLFDSSRNQLVQAAAPNLPDDFNELLVEGLPVGPAEGSCGTAAYRKERVIVQDIKKSPLFKKHKEAIKRATSGGLLACWSQPIVSSSGELLGTIANYSNRKGKPDAESLVVLEWSARIAAISIERKQAEEARQKVDKLESLGTLAGGLAHDFNNLLTGIMGNINLARENLEVVDTKLADTRLEEAEAAAAQAKRLTLQLLTFATGGAPIRKVLAINDLVKDSATFALRGSNVKCEFALPDDIWAVECDEGQVGQVVSNLVLNADQAMPKGGTINIGVKNITIGKEAALPLAKGRYVRISVADHGVGIAKKNLSRVFDPYFSTKEEGSGLGLATAYSIIKNHGGYIDVESKLGAGTTFNVYLPASRKSVPVKREAAAKVQFTGTGRVLVMDDEELIRKLLSSELTKAGYEVELTEDGAGTIKRYTKAMELGNPFDVVILDLTVPGGMGGKEVIEKLLEIDPGVKAIVSSGYSTDPIMSDFASYGFKGVVAKPFKMAEMLERLQSIITGESA